MIDTNSTFTPHTFLGLGPEFSGPEKSSVYILPVPYDGTVSYNTGTRKGPNAIIQASKHVELFDYELNCDMSRIGIHTLNELEPIMAGPDKMTDSIAKVAFEIIEKEKFLVTLGGEHSISIGLVKAHAERFNNLSVLQFDAHADLRDIYMGTPYSHASAMRRIGEMVPTVQAGIRSFSQEEAEFFRNKNLPVISAEEILFSHDYLDLILNGLTENVYITFDLDVLDPSIMPSTGTPEPGGLDWYTVLKILRKVSEKKQIVGFDIVELAPMPGNNAPDFLAAKLTYKMISYSMTMHYERLCLIR